MKTVALIPARGGSKRLPRKNILPFLGKPMIAYSIEAALQSDLFTEVYVSTDDNEISEIASRYGAKVILRDEDLSGDKIMVKEVVLDSFNKIEYPFELLCVLYATAPMRTAEDIYNTYSLIEQDVCHHAIAATEYIYPPHQALKKISSKGDIEPMWPDIVDLRADALPELIVDNGSTYFVKVDDFKKEPKFYNQKMRANIMPHWKSVDIDTQEGFNLAEYYAKQHLEVNNTNLQEKA